MATVRASNSVPATTSVVQPRAGQKPMENTAATASETPSIASMARMGTSSRTPFKGRLLSPFRATDVASGVEEEPGRAGLFAIVNDAGYDANPGRMCGFRARRVP